MPSSVRFRRDEPDGLGLVRGGREIERHGLERRAVARRPLLVRDDVLGHGNTPERELDAAPALDAKALLDRRLRVLLRLRVPVARERLDERDPCVEVEPFDEVRLPEVEVDGAVVHGRVRALALDDAEHGAVARADDEHGIGARRTERHARRRVVAAGPDEASARPAKLRQLGRAIDRFVSERRSVLVVDRRLERSGEDVPVEDAVVRVVRDRRLDAAAEQRLGLAHEVLVERVLGRDEHCEAVTRPPCSAPLLAQARDRAGEADRDDAVEQPDVDPELERVRRGDGQQLSGREPLLDVAALRRRVARSVRGEPVCVLAAQAVERESVDQLRRLAALREAERALPLLDEARRRSAPRRRARSHAG